MLKSEIEQINDRLKAGEDLDAVLEENGITYKRYKHFAKKYGIFYNVKLVRSGQLKYTYDFCKEILDTVLSQHTTVRKYAANHDVCYDHLLDKMNEYDLITDEIRNQLRKNARIGMKKPVRTETVLKTRVVKVKVNNKKTCDHCLYRSDCRSDLVCEKYKPDISTFIKKQKEVLIVKE